jgi:hydroxymethylpyrimidine pyrophosphatase-like HAD family hydrolase
MKYKMLVLDLDDTLLTDDHTISVENAAMLFKAQELEFMLFWLPEDQRQQMIAYAKELQLIIRI